MLSFIFLRGGKAWLGGAGGHEPIEDREESGDEMWHSAMGSWLKQG